VTVVSFVAKSLPKDDPELYRINLEAARKARGDGGDAHPVVYVEIEALLPPRSRLVNPRVTARPSLSFTAA